MLGNNVNIGEEKIEYEKIDRREILQADIGNLGKAKIIDEISIGSDCKDWIKTTKSNENRCIDIAKVW